LLATEEAIMRAMLSVGAIVGAGLVSVGAASPDDSASLAPVHIGDRVRVSAPSVSDTRIRGTLVALDEETLIVAPEGKTPQIEMSRSQVTRLQVSRGKRSHWVAGAVTGVVGGLALTASYCGSGGALGGGCSGDDALGVAAFFCGIGAAGGALVGAVVRTDRWEMVPANTVAVSIIPVPVRRGMALGVRIAF
jgi:hypothetical protein